MGKILIQLCHIQLRKHDQNKTHCCLLAVRCKIEIKASAVMTLHSHRMSLLYYYVLSNFFEMNFLNYKGCMIIVRILLMKNSKKQEIFLFSLNIFSQIKIKPSIVLKCKYVYTYIYVYLYIYKTCICCH